MAATSQTPEITNELLRSLPPASLRAAMRHLDPVEFSHRQSIYEPGEQIKYAFFPGEHALISVIASNEDGELAEVAIVGAEGLLGFTYAMGAAESAHRVYVQIPGQGWRMKITALDRLFTTDREFRKTVLRYANFVMLQMAQTALCNRLHTVEERLARWLLLSEERVRKDQIPMTHETLSHMLGTRRSTVTLAAAVFQEAGLIRYQRGRITIIDRHRLQQAACPCYGAYHKYLRWLDSGR